MRQRPPAARLRAIIAALALALVLAADSVPLASFTAPALAQDLTARQDRSAVARLPADRKSRHVLTLVGRSIEFDATAGSIPIRGPDGRLQAEIAYIAYVKAGSDRRRRPVVFAVNGGPGASSAWLHLGAMGPWRLPLVISSASTRPQGLVPNAETWLDFADLVFIDPAGTGFSRLTDSPEAIARYLETRSRRRRRDGGSREPRLPSTRADGGPGWFWSVHGDIESLGEVIATWLTSNARLASPAIIVGESYGGFRGPRLAAILRARHQILIRGLVLVSPVLDFETRRSRDRPAYFADILPSLAAVGLELRAEAPTRQALRDAEVYAAKGFLPDLEQFTRDDAAATRLATTVAGLTGLPVEAVRRRGGRLAGRAFLDELNALGHDSASLYDASIRGFGPRPDKPDKRRSDAFTDRLAEPLTSAMLEIYDQRLGWRGEGTYELLSRTVNRFWVWASGSSGLESMTALETALASNSYMRVMIVHGFTDLVTPYFATLGPLARVEQHVASGRIGFNVYPGGHMFYDRDRSRAMFTRDAARFSAGLQSLDD